MGAFFTQYKKELTFHIFGIFDKIKLCEKRMISIFLSETGGVRSDENFFGIGMVF